jgi:hypothetical protein
MTEVNERARGTNDIFFPKDLKAFQHHYIKLTLNALVIYVIMLRDQDVRIFVVSRFYISYSKYKDTLLYRVFI